MEVTFFLKQDEISKSWHAYSVLSTLAGFGETKEEAIGNHLKRFSEAYKSSKLYHSAKQIPGITIEKYSFVMADEKAPM